MKIVKAKDYNDLSRKAANIISAQIIMKPHCVLGLATGSTPIGTYKQLVEWYNKGDLDFSEVTTVNLDEYKGLNRDNDQSYYYFMNENLFSKVNIDRNRTFLPDGTEPDSKKACDAYNQIIHSVGGVDMQLLGLGHNGHIGFNEPGIAFEKDVPKEAYTMGIKTIMSAHRILVVVSGADKAEAVKNAFFGPVTPAVPGSILQLHNDVTVVADEAALSLCEGLY